MILKALLKPLAKNPPKGAIIDANKPTHKACHWTGKMETSFQGNCTREWEERERERVTDLFLRWKFKSHALIRGIALQYTETGGDESGCQTRHSWIRHVKCQGNASNT